MSDCNRIWSRGGCTPVITVDDEGNCEGPAGTPTVQSPIFVSVVDNGPDLIWRDEDYTVIQADDDGTPFEFDNVF